MISLYDELTEKIERSSGLSRRNSARRDLGLVLISEREAMRDLWKAAETLASRPGLEGGHELWAAVERLRPLFGERP